MSLLLLVSKTKKIRLQDTNIDGETYNDFNLEDGPSDLLN